MKNTENISLNGIWDFFYSPRKFEVPTSELPRPQDFSGKMNIPGYWDDHYELFDEEDFFGLTARFNPDYRKPHFPMGRTLTPHASSSFLIGTGFYRKKFTLPENFKHATLTVGPAMWECFVFCNGNFAGSSDGYSTVSRHILDDFIIRGGDNELIIAVCNLHDDGGAYHRLDKSHDGIPFGARPGQHRGLAAQGYQSERGGINCGVSLKLTENAELTDYFISFENGTPTWHVESRGSAAELKWAMLRNGKTVDSGSLPIDGKVRFTSACPPSLWSDRNPELYDICLTLQCGGNICDEVSFRWGARELKNSGMSLLLNGIPTFFRGVTEHCYFPETTNPHCDKEKYLHDLGVLKNAGFNFIRCHTWCPPEAFYDACDELGILVQTELPSVWDFDEARAVLRQIRRHACAVIFCEGNEKIIDETAIIRLQKLVDMIHEMAPGMLFNPQEAMRGIEYEFSPDREIAEYPLKHDVKRLERVRKFSDCFGALGEEFSYAHDTFISRENTEKRTAVYQRPCLYHESGILGGYLDFEQEARYKGTFIGTDLFEAARENMQKHGVYEKARLFYEKNSLYISSCRKQLIENLRFCRNIAGFDYLGGIDTHWHLIGYPCGIFNEFYEEKFGESISDVRRYCGESILLCSSGNRRNRACATTFSEEIEFACYEADGIDSARVQWSFETADGSVIASGSTVANALKCGTVSPVAKVAFDIPQYKIGTAAILRTTLAANGKEWENFWNFWIFPTDSTIPKSVRICNDLDENDIAFMENGGSLLLIGNFPTAMSQENFRSHTSGRSLGHAGALLYEHPIWKKFPHDTFMDWQFFPLMKDSQSMIYDDGMPEFRPIFELIPSFKLVKHKSMLSEFAVGKGRLMISGWRFDADDPAAAYMLRCIAEYLAEGSFVDAPQWDADDLRKRINEKERFSRLNTQGKKVDAGGRPID